MWKDLTLLLKSDLMQLYIKNGITDLDKIINHYNKFKRGGSMNIVKGTNNPFEYARKQYTTNTMSEDFARELNDSVMARNFGFAPEILAHGIGTESGYNVNAKNPNSTAKGIFLLTRTTLRQMYGDKQGDLIYNQYVNNKRSQTNQIHDAMTYILKIDDNIKSNRQDMSAGRFKANLLAPNSAMTAKISDAVWQHSLTKDLRNALTKGKSTYNDLADFYNKGYNIFLEGYNAQKPIIKGRKKEFGGYLVNEFRKGGGMPAMPVVYATSKRPLLNLIPDKVSKGLSAIAGFTHGELSYLNPEQIKQYWQYGLESEYPELGFLMSPEKQKRFMESIGYRLVNDNNYGMVNKASQRLSRRKLSAIPIYQLGNDDISPDSVELISVDPKIVESYLERIPDERKLRDAGNYPSALYKEKNGERYFVKSWDLNDYGKHGQKAGGTEYGGFSQLLANLYDYIGTPFVLRTGLIQVPEEEIYNKDVNLEFLRNKLENKFK